MDEELRQVIEQYVARGSLETKIFRQPPQAIARRWTSRSRKNIRAIADNSEPVNRSVRNAEGPKA